MRYHPPELPPAQPLRSLRTHKQGPCTPFLRSESRAATLRYHLPQNSPPHSPCDPCALTRGAPAPHFFVANRAQRPCDTISPRTAPRTALAILAQHCESRSDLAIPSPPEQPPAQPLRSLRTHKRGPCTPFLRSESRSDLAIPSPRTAPRTALAILAQHCESRSDLAIPSPRTAPRPALAILAQHCESRSDLAIPSPPEQPPAQPLRSLRNIANRAATLRYHLPQNCPPHSPCDPCATLRIAQRPCDTISPRTAPRTALAILAHSQAGPLHPISS